VDASDDAPVRYDDLAEGYARHWGPVIRPAAEALVDHVAGPVPPGSRILDVGTGTGTLAIAALERWPGVAVTGIDPSGAMLEIARGDARERLSEGAARGLETMTGLADRLPFEEASFDIAMSSFVLQLVPNRSAALREIRRVLRPGGRFAWLTWLVGGGAFRPDEVVDEVLGEFGFDPPEHDDRSGDLASVAAAASATRRAGFREVRATAGTLQHTWTANDYAAFIAEFDEETLFSDLERDERRRIERRLRERLGRLTPEELTVRLPIVYVSGVLPGSAPVDAG
jgi:SAM-dependent methyltransferase